MHFMFDSCKVIQDAQYRAVAKFFVMGGGGGIIASAEGMSLAGPGVSSPRKGSNLEAMKWYFQHSS